MNNTLILDNEILAPDLETMNHIFFAAAPFHVICINEIHKRDPSKNFELILILHKKNTLANMQIYKTLQFFGFEKYTVLYSSHNPIVNYFRNLLFIYKLFNRSHSKNLIFTMFDFRNSFMHSLRRFFQGSKFILIDDGFSTYSSYQRYIIKGYYLAHDRYLNIRGIFLKWVYFGSHFNYLLRTKIDIFSIYVEDFGVVDKDYLLNDLRHLRKLVSAISALNFDTNKVFFIGGKLSERGAMSLNDELFCMDWLNKYWKSKGKTMFYIAKRSSSIKKLDLISKAGIDVLTFDLPLEIALMNEKILPGIICAPGSTLLKTLPMLYDKIECYQIEMTDFFKFEDAIEQAEFIQEFIKGTNIKTININKN